MYVCKIYTYLNTKTSHDIVYPTNTRASYLYVIHLKETHSPIVENIMQQISLLGLFICSRDWYATMCVRDFGRGSTTVDNDSAKYNMYGLETYDTHVFNYFTQCGYIQ